MDSVFSKAMPKKKTWRPMKADTRCMSREICGKGVIKMVYLKVQGRDESDELERRLRKGFARLEILQHCKACPGEQRLGSSVGEENGGLEESSLERAVSGRDRH